VTFRAKELINWVQIHNTGGEICGLIVESGSDIQHL